LPDEDAGVSQNERTTTASESAYSECRWCGVLGEVVPCACASTLARRPGS